MAVGTTTERLERAWAEPGGLVNALTTVDHKRIGVRYLVTATVFFILAGLEALTMRLQLATPDGRLLTPNAYDQLFTMHGVTMIFLFVTPMLSGFGNYFVPLMIGARDMAFPRLNALSYWVYLGSGLFLYSSLVLGMAPNDGWFNYAPLSSGSPGTNIDFYGYGLIFLGISSTVGAANFITTIFKLRAPGMSINRMPLFCWAVLATSFSIIFAVPSLTADCALLELSRNWGFHFFDAAHGGDPLLWQHLFWIFGHPDVYIIFLPAVGIVSTIIPVFSRRPMVAHTWVALATMATGVLGFGVWVHHMFAVGLPQVSMTFFSAASMVIAIPSGLQIFAWLATVISGRPVIRTPFLYVLGFIVVFVIGGLSGVMFAVISFDQQITDSYFVVAHFHYVLFGGAVFPIIAGVYYWLPKISGRMFSERLGVISFWLVFIGFNLTFFPMHISGLLGMPRRVWTYPSGMGWDIPNMLSTIGAFVLAVGILAIIADVVYALVAGPPAGDDPWDANTLEWATSSPPPAWNFATVPIVRSADPNWDTDDRADDQRRADRGALVLDEGHQTVATTELDADLEAALHMPGESYWPLALAGSITIIFVGLITGTTVATWIGVALSVISLAGWHQTAHGDDSPTVLDVERPSGWWGMWLLVATEATLFGILIATYFYLRFHTPSAWPPDGLAKPAILKPLIATAILVASSVPIAIAARRGTGATARLVALAVAVALAVVFLAFQAVLVSDALDTFRPHDDAYASAFYVLIGLHAAHVVVGILIALWTATFGWRLGAVRLPTRLTALYWYFVNAMALLVFATLYLSPRL
jgi:cytochrome c oxidase subunit I+III